MLFRVLKKDLLKRKAVNFILLIFIVLSTVFLASSVNNIIVVTSAIDYCLEYADVPDADILVSGREEHEMISKWLDEESDYVDSYEYIQFLVFQEKSIKIKKEAVQKSYDSGGGEVNLSSVQDKYNRVFDENGGSISLKEGEVALNRQDMERNNLKVMDRLVITQAGVQKEFVIKQIIRDIAFGRDMVGMKRMVVNEKDFKFFENQSDIIGQYCVETKDLEALQEQVSEEQFSTLINVISKDMYRLIFSFDMLMAALLILIGICLILIAMLVLRFTLVFTMEESYQEIGIMKAVGIKDVPIKKIYLVKYLFLVSLGAIAGLMISFPVSTFMVRSVSKNMFMENSSVNVWWNITCAILIVVLVLLFCYGCTRKLGRISVMTAIRGGQTGERFVPRRGFSLWKRSKMKLTVYLGINDIVSHLKRYMVLVVTFAVSFVLITIPLNTLNTMNSDEMVKKFMIDPSSAVYVKKIESESEQKYRSEKELKAGLDRLDREMLEKGYDVELTASIIYFIKYRQEAGKEQNIMTVKLTGPNTGYEEYEEGQAPTLENEVAFSRSLMEAQNWVLGDTVWAVLDGKPRSFLITGTYTDYLQLGNSARISPAADCGKEWLFDYWNIMVDMKTDKTQSQLASELKKEFPDYEWYDAQEFVDQNVGGIKQSLADLMLPMTGLLCLIIMLITILMEKLFIVREKGEIAMMKSMGFRNSNIRNWQIIRMVCVAAVSMVAAVPLSLVSNRWILHPIFAIMGADVNIQIVPWQVYGVYPAILFLGIVLATAFASSGIRKIHIRELNNLE